MGFFSEMRALEERGLRGKKKRGMVDGYTCLSRKKIRENKGQVEGLALKDISPFKTEGEKKKNRREEDKNI